jgi:hypothetical protein
VTQREITNASANTQAIEREFNNHTKIAHVRLIVKKKQILLVSTLRHELVARAGGENKATRIVEYNTSGLCQDMTSTMHFSRSIFHCQITFMDHTK